MKDILNAFAAESEFTAAVSSLLKKKSIQFTGICPNAYSAFCAALSNSLSKKLVIICSDEREVNRIAGELTFYGKKVLVYPMRDFILDNISSYSREWEHQRLSVLNRLMENDFDILLSVPDAAMQFTIPPDVLIEKTIKLEVGKDIKLDYLINSLLSMGYVRAELVEGAGQFSLRGGILDVFSPQYNDPIRMDFFGDTLDSAGFFEIMTQRRFSSIDEIQLIPASEVIYDERTADLIASEIEALRKRTSDTKLYALLSEELERLQSGGRIPADKYFGTIYKSKKTMLDYIGESVFVSLDSKRNAERAKAYEWKHNESIEYYVGKGVADYKNVELIIPAQKLFDEMGKNVLGLDSFMSESVFSYTDRFFINTRPSTSFTTGKELLFEDIEKYLKAKQRILIMCATAGSAKTLLELLEEKEIPAYPYQKKLHDEGIAVAVQSNEAAAGYNGGMLSGFEVQSAGFVLITDSEAVRGILKSSKAAARKKASKNTEKIASYADLIPGDLVVHANHGIGCYEGIQNLKMDGISKDYIKIQYHGSDVLYVPCEQLDMVSKYIGGTRETQRLSKLGGTEWLKAKTRVKKAAKDIAKDLIALYSERMQKKGHAFSHDDEMQREFDDAFEYVETDGQLQAADDIKRDMENEVPMDRLLCGDVGFGKTEVAMRAIFKCVCDGYQAAVLVPTTILAWQHYQTMLTRFRSFPVKIDMVSRFKTKAAQNESLMKLKRGEIDVIIGTHRLLQKDVEFGKLGLLIVDEEQRFGVTHKEKLKQLAKNIDVLTLTATPIPRTLNMALSGIRDMSVLEEAPSDRMPVQTFVLEHDEMIINEAIKSELRRGGQCFYLHNNTDTIYSKAAALQNVFPESSVGIAHGKMSRDELSKIWESLVEGEIDILVCTTIIETGVDVPNANTLIVEDANNLGLSQLHQIRGRVGRSYRKAYAYFTYTKDKIISEIAEKRLEALREFTEFGSGFKIAMRDLELRGAGNLLGAEQHGNMEAVGYDLYIKILEEAVLEEKGEKPPKRKEALVDIPVDAYIPEWYITSQSIRIDVYKKIAAIDTPEDCGDLKAELVDRFGEIPQSVSNLLDVSLMRSVASENGFSSVEARGGCVNLYYSKTGDEQAEIISGLINSEALKSKIMISNGVRPYIALKILKNESVFECLKLFFKEYTKLSQK